MPPNCQELPLGNFIYLILQVPEEKGGEARIEDLIPGVKKRMKNKLTSKLSGL